MNAKNYLFFVISLILISITLQAKSSEADKLPVVVQELVLAPLVPAHDIVAKGGPKVIRVEGKWNNDLMEQLMEPTRIAD